MGQLGPMVVEGWRLRRVDSS